MSASRTLMIMAGGTGGHIFPALSVAEYVRAQGWNVVWLGSRAGMEARIVPAHGYTLAQIRFSGLRGKGLVPMALLPLNLLIAFWQSARAVFAHRPDVVLGMGGYVAFPGGMMASLLNRPLAIHEQNSVAGLTNRVLGQLADKVLVGFPDAFGSADQSGMDRQSGACRHRRHRAARDSASAVAQGALRLLVLGGSQGAQALNEVVPQALARLDERMRPEVTHQAGAAHTKRRCASDTQQRALLRTSWHSSTTWRRRYAEADLMICRAGASTIAELAAAGVAAVLVPFPQAVDDHQTHNARFLSERGAAILIPQSRAHRREARRSARELDREKLLAMAQGRARRRQARGDARRGRSVHEARGMKMRLFRLPPPASRLPGGRHAP